MTETVARVVCMGVILGWAGIVGAAILYEALLAMLALVRMVG